MYVCIYIYVVPYCRYLIPVPAEPVQVLSTI